MLRVRVIPILLLADDGLVKTKKFKNPVYIGDPINAVKIFNDKEVDELCLLDIEAGKNKRKPDIEKIKEIVSESFMPISYGGGIRSLTEIESLVKAGVEKISINTAAHNDSQLISDAVHTFGSSTVVLSVDIKKNLFGKYHIFTKGGTQKMEEKPLEFIKRMEDLGVGEILLTVIENEGEMKGYNNKLIKSISSQISIPLIANGGAGSVDDFYDGVSKGGASAVAAGSMFVFHGKLRGILINYPTQEEFNEKLFNKWK